MAEFKYNYIHRHEDQFFDLAADPGERPLADPARTGHIRRDGKMEGRRGSTCGRPRDQGHGSDRAFFHLPSVAE